MEYKFKQLLQSMAKGEAPGPSPSFSTFHLLLAIELMAEKTIGRNRLADVLGVGKGAVRTIIDRLKSAGLLETSKTGCSITEKGKSLFKEYTSVVRKARIGKNELALAEYNYAILVKNHGHKIRQGMEQRDAAVIAGAKGATTMVYRGGVLVIPSVSNNVAKDYPKAASQIVEFYRPNENDVIVIVGADSSQKGEHSALASAWTLLNDHK